MVSESTPAGLVGRAALLGCLSFALVFSFGCDPKKPTTKADAGTTAGAKGKAPAAVKSKSRTIEVTAAKAAEGKTLYATCAGCHGAEGEGKVGTAPRLASKSFLAAASDEMLVKVIAEGRTGTTMIPWKTTYKPAQIEAIVAYLRTQTPSEPITLDEKPLAGDAEKGAEVFSSICSACHGRTGGGYQETASGTGIGRKGFLDGTSDGFLRYIIKNGKDQTAMRPFDKKAKTAVANLTDAEIENVIAHLRKSAW